MEKAGMLTAALEDYLEAIFNLCRFNNAARSRDIAESLNVHKSTVTAALKSLSQMRLVNYAPYEAVTLTPEGKKLAEDVAKRHAALKNFFVHVLNVDDAMAETAACGMEHAMPREIVERLAEFATTMKGCPRIANAAPEEPPAEEACRACLDKPAGKSSATALFRKLEASYESLDEIGPGQTVTIVSIKGGGAVKKYLTEMGIDKSGVIAVERVDPSNGMMEITIKGGHVLLRMEDAARIMVHKEA
jgi:Mn-dependent transcriptional regulator